MLFNNILVATDLGRTSKAAVAYGIQLAAEQHARLHLLHAVPNPATQPWVAEAYLIDLKRIAADAQRRATRALTGLVPPAKRRALRVFVSTPLEPAAQAIVGYARRHAIDLIVVGTHGRGRIPRALLGSVADRVIREASCAVMVVRRAKRRARRAAKAA